MNEKLRYLGLAAMVTAGTLVSQGSSLVEAGGGCGPDWKGPYDKYLLVKDTDEYTILEYRYCDSPTNALLVESKTRFLGFLWKTNEGAVKGVEEVKQNCELAKDIRQPVFFRKDAAIEVYLARDGCMGSTP